MWLDIAANLVITAVEKHRADVFTAETAARGSVESKAISSGFVQRTELADAASAKRIELETPSEIYEKRGPV